MIGWRFEAYCSYMRSFEFQSIESICYMMIIIERKIYSCNTNITIKQKLERSVIYLLIDLYNFYSLMRWLKNLWNEKFRKTVKI